jgi:hypothetical protein
VNFFDLIDTFVGELLGILPLTSENTDLKFDEQLSAVVRPTRPPNRPQASHPRTSAAQDAGGVRFPRRLEF